EDDELLAVPATPAPTAKKSPGSRPGKKAAPVRREVQELKNDWTQTKAAYAKLIQQVPCETQKMGLLCSRYDALKEAVVGLGDGYDKDIHNRVKKMRTEL